MLIVLGYLIVVGAVLGGYMMTGGHLGALYQPSELIIIGGAGVGAFIVGNNGKAIKRAVNKKYFISVSFIKSYAYLKAGFGEVKKILENKFFLLHSNSFLHKICFCIKIYK